jgi:hypothetical protein
MFGWRALFSPRQSGDDTTCRFSEFWEIHGGFGLED